MATKSVFPETLEFDGAIWHMVYDPKCETTVMPNLAGANILSIDRTPVRFPGATADSFMVTTDIIFPAHADSQGRLVNERRMKGFRTYDYAPASPAMVKPEELVYYVAEPTTGNGSAAQRFLNALVGARGAEAPVKDTVDTSWIDKFGGKQGVAVGEVPPAAKPEVMGPPDKSEKKIGM